MSKKLAVIGAGLMGSGIAQVAAAAGYDVAVRDVTDAALKRGTDGIRASLEKFAARGRYSGDEVEAALGRLSTTTDLAEAVDGADVVVEAVFENVEVKQEIFRELDRLAKPGAVLATNTSAIPITQIAAVTSRPRDVVGTHFFSPVPMMQLCELVRGYKTSDETLAKARAFAEEVGKTCIVVNRDVAGFVTTRLEDIDLACRLGFGHAMGPLATTDLTGVDILRNATRNIYTETQDEKFSPPELLNRMVTAVDLGRQTGKGVYSY
ncbi:MAG: 3-hydroxybutyryl-CoA dehydrogenase [Catenulispora sp. 13_1_20CM_3_70_7]|nr:MAG: 3-hydroxybutyryl-CoA dehydrogenase [Catenulispora sp. 13_1_20CM_3_70_7]